MPRIPLTPESISTPTDLVAELRRRHGGELLEVERMMLHSPALAEAWNGFFARIKSGMVSPRLREMVCCAVGSLNGATYQIDQHAGPYLAAGGTAKQLEALHRPPEAAVDALLFDAADRAILKLTVEMTRDVRVSDATFSEARAAMDSDGAMVELVGVVAGYNLVSRFLVALGIGGAAPSIR